MRIVAGDRKSGQQLAEENRQLRARVAELEAKAAAGRKPAVRGATHQPPDAARLLDLVQNANTALRESEGRLRLFIEHAPAALAMFDREMRYLSVSRRWLDDYGLQGRDLRGLSHYEVFPEIPERWREIHRRGLSGEVVRADEDPFERADGSAQWLRWEVRPWHDADGQVGGILIFSEDVTGRKRTEETLQRTTARFALLSETAGALLASRDPQAMVEDLCGKVMRHLGCDVFFNFLADEPSGRLRLNACAGIPGEEARKIEWLDYGVAVCGCVARDGQRIIAQDIPATPDPRTALVGSYGVQAYCCHPLMAGERLIGTLSFGTKRRPRFTADEVELMHAVTDQVAVAMERIRTEQSLRQAKAVAESASKAKDQFIAVLSHELRTPLTPALAAISAMQDDVRLPRDVRDDLAMVQRNLGLEVRLIADLLDISRIISGKLRLETRPVDVAAAIREAALIVSGDLDAKSQVLTIETPGAPYVAAADAARLQQVFWNLLRNAIKFTPERGRIAIHASIEDAGQSGGHELVVKVSDTGAGIAPDALPRLFNAFEQARDARTFGGLGLGLAICRAVLEMHGGSIAAHSDGLGQGATFTVRLPVVKAAPGARDLSPALAPPAAAGRRVSARRVLRILLVEDHADTARLMKRLLTADGHEVMTANSVAAAMKAAEQARPDVLVSDIGLPDGTGLDLIRQLRAAGNAVPAIALSGYGTAADVESSKAAGFAEHLTKPVRFEDLQAALVRLAAEGAAAGTVDCLRS